MMQSMFPKRNFALSSELPKHLKRMTYVTEAWGTDEEGVSIEATSEEK